MNTSSNFTSTSERSEITILNPETFTFYRIFCDSKGPHLIEAKYILRKEGHFTYLANLNSKAHHRTGKWPCRFTKEYHLYEWHVFVDPKEAWKDFIVRQQREIDDKTRSLKQTEKLLQQAIRRSK